MNNPSIGIHISVLYHRSYYHYNHNHNYHCLFFPAYIMSTNNKDIFTLFDKKAQGSIDSSMVGDYLRAIGYNPTNKQVQDLIDSQDNSASNGTFTLDQLEQLISDNQQLLDSTTQSKVEDFIKAFQVFDKDNTGKVTVGDLKYMLTGLGEKLSDDEVEELLKGIDVDSDGGIDYRKFIEDILRQ
ncbi:Mlc1p PWA37_002093 [Arxiozyma heterogenica]|uniref:Mlc1p n=1 Tax=Arxiozyma heterogenica TaxID=278026 RepID=UPI002EF573CE